MCVNDLQSVVISRGCINGQEIELQIQTSSVVIHIPI
jgi:hypothetical protein